MIATSQISNRIPAGIWPSLLVLAMATFLVGGMFGFGYFSVQRLATTGSFLPTHRTPWFSESVMSYGMAYALDTEGQDDVLITGGSAALAGLVTRSYQNATAKRAYNFGSNIDIGPDLHFEFIETYLRSHQRPEAIIYIATARDVGDEQPLDIEVRNRFARVYSPSTADVKMPLAFAASFYMMEGKFAMERLVKSGNLHPFDAPRGRRLSHNELAPELAAQRGFQEYPQSTRINTRYLSLIDQFTISDWYAESFREMARRSQELGIPLIIYFTPIPKNEFNVDDGPLAAWAEALEADFPGTKVHGLPLVQYDLDLWGNEFHLNRKGAERFTAVVANSLESTAAKVEGR